MPLALPPIPPPALVPAAPAVTRVALPVRADFLTEEEALALFFPAAERFEKKLQLAPKGLDLSLRRGKTPRHYFRYEAWRGTELLGFAVVDEVMGKARPITYMLATDRGPKVLGIELLAYRESHGGEIERAAFRDQFKDRDPGDVLRLGGDIRNITGATISCRAITDGVADMLDLIQATLPAEAPIQEPVESQGAEVLPRVDLAAVAENADRLTRVRVAMNTPLAIALQLDEADPGPARAPALAATEAAFQEVERLEDALSVFRPNSDPARLAASDGSTWVSVQTETYELLSRALEVSVATGGAVTPLAGPLTKLARSAPAASPASRAAAAKQCAARLVELETTAESGARVRFLRRGMGLDFGASGKGYALDKVRASLRELGQEQGLLDFGGQLLALGPGAFPVELPGGAHLTLTSGSLATTGDTERGLGGSHLFDARDGSPVVPHGAVTVFAASALDADLWSSALYVLGDEAGLALAETNGIAARFLGSNPGDAPTMSSAWRAQFPSTR